GYQYFMGSGAESEYGHNWHKDILNAWTPENPNTDVPRLDASAPYSFYSYLCDRGLISSNYFAINNITFGYTLPASLTGKIGIETIRVYGAADNVALWSARKGLDPRQSYTTSTTSTYTALRCISGGIKVVF
ncbi:MAG: SusC/RagA family TonB-linked outer membrane protein, partial [Duncaniella sp.]|nr:SusC/RagA family TonB-linked outer membrane protein [Duncaniella sp.]